eukprot:TRINITY_DN7153_c3_g2_i1.p1 TRINITY_DN7153_c3_g2~~TRINITY_DN7153_c3_g2_i1.p1  ORF type:complete len:1198 (+),score=272.04 TRINITY_DN7153_c3_g2_i1:152-3745(+)
MAPCLDADQFDNRHFQTELEHVHSSQLLDAAIAAFDYSVLPSGAALSGHDGEELRKRAEKLMGDHGVRVLVGSSEKLLAAVAGLTGCRSVPEILGRMPRLVARQSLMLALGDVMPELLERRWLKTQVGELQAKQVSSTTTYLQELGALRSLLRQHVGEGKTVAWEHTARNETDSPTRSPLRRINFQEHEPDTAKAESLETSPPVEKSLAGIVGDIQCSSRQSKTLGTTVKRSQSNYSSSPVKVSASTDEGGREVNTSFGNVHHYLWDPLDYVPCELKPVVSQVVAEKLACFENQTIAASAAELAALCRKMEAFTREQAAFKVQEKLNEALQTIAKKDEEIQGLMESLQKAKAESQEHALNIFQLRTTLEKNGDTYQKELHQIKVHCLVVEQQLEQAVKDLTCIKAEKDKESLKKQKAAEERKALLDLPETGPAERESTVLEGFFGGTLSVLARHLGQALPDRDTKQVLLLHAQRMTAVVQSLERKRQAAEKSFSSCKLTLAATEARAVELEDTLRKEKQERASEVEELAARVLKAETSMKTIHSDLEAYVTESPAFVAQVTENKDLKDQLEAHRKMVNKLEHEYTILMERHEFLQARMSKEISERDVLLEQVRRELREACDSQFHPAKVAELRAELRHFKHECMALANANSLLRSSLQMMREREQQLFENIALDGKTSQLAPLEAAGGPQAHLLMDTCDRTVFTRLYEDAVRRKEYEPAAEGLAVLSATRPWIVLDEQVQAAEANDYSVRRAQTLPLRIQTCGQRPSSAPPALRLVSKMEFKDMLSRNAEDLHYSIREPLFKERLRSFPVRSEKVPVSPVPFGKSKTAHPLKRVSSTGSMEDPNKGLLGPGGHRRAASETPRLLQAADDENSLKSAADHAIRWAQQLAVMGAAKACEGDDDPLSRPSARSLKRRRAAHAAGNDSLQPPFENAAAEDATATGDPEVGNLQDSQALSMDSTFMSSRPWSAASQTSTTPSRPVSASCQQGRPRPTSAAESSRPSSQDAVAESSKVASGPEGMVLQQRGRKPPEATTAVALPKSARRCSSPGARRNPAALFGVPEQPRRPASAAARGPTLRTGGAAQACAGVGERATAAWPGKHTSCDDEVPRASMPLPPPVIRPKSAAERPRSGLLRCHARGGSGGSAVGACMARIAPRGVPRVADKMLPCMRPKSAKTSSRPSPPFQSTVPARPATLAG